MVLISVAAIKTDLETVNKAKISLEGCIQATVDNITSYIYTTVVYCTINMGLVALNLRLAHILRKRAKAQSLYEDYMIKAERQAMSFV